MCLLGLFFAASASRGADDLVVTFQVRPDVKPETLRAIAALLEPERATAMMSKWNYEVLRDRYGSSHQKLRSLFAQYNKGRTQVKQGQEIVYPPAPEWSFNVETKLPDVANVSSYVLAKMGVAGPKTLASVAESTGVTTASLDQMKQGDTLVLPYVSPVVSYRVRADRMADVQRIVNQLQESDEAIELIEVTPELTLSPHFSNVAGTEGLCNAQTALHASPCNLDPSSYPVVSKAIVAVLDSGIAYGDPRFQFWQNPGEAGKRRWIDDDANDYVDDVIGTDMITKGGYPTDDVMLASIRNHGTHVAGIASCRLATEAQRKAINDRVDIMVLKVARSDGKIAPDAVSDAIVYVIEYGAHVVNMSFEGSKSRTVRKFVQLAPNILFVAAAGNGENRIGLDLASHDVYPAKLAKDLPNIMSVAAHDANRHLTCFSNWNGEIVDIAAPGLGVRSTIGEEGEAELSGTSQATPLVSLVAALLHSRGLDDPKAIRERLVVSADFVPEMRGMVRSDGVLNAEKALAYDRDIVRTAAATYYGEIESPQSLAVPWSAQPIALAAVRKIVNGYSSAPGESVKFLLASESRKADVALPAITIRTATGSVTVPGPEVVEIIPKLH